MASAFSRSAADRRRLLAQIAERDGWVCHWCGLPVARGLPADDPMHASIDHIVPRRDGGTGARDNLRLAHHKCNHERDARDAAKP